MTTVLLGGLQSTLLRVKADSTDWTTMESEDNGMEIDPSDARSLSFQQRHRESDEGASETIPSSDNDVVRIEENGRMYTSNDYFLPDDSSEETRQSILHQAFTLVLDRKLFMSLNTNTTLVKILDVGTGSGDWALAAATHFPSTTIVATDISPSMGSACSQGMPANLNFELNDARSTPWPFESESFDLIHLRGLGGAFTDLELSSVLREAQRCLRSGGTLETGDFGTVTLNPVGELPAASVSEALATSLPLSGDMRSYLDIYNAAMKQASSSRGLVGANDTQHLAAARLEAAGFRVQRQIRPAVPLGEWSTDPRNHSVGRMATVAMLEGLEAKALRLMTRELGWSMEDIGELCERTKAEIMNSEARPAVQCHFVTARKLTA